MTSAQIITTFFGAFLFPFIICTAWGKLFGKYDLAGSLLAAGFIVGTSWMLNHGGFSGIPGVLDGAKGMQLIVQGQNAPWVDMAWASGSGIFVNGVVNGGKVGKAIPSLVCAIIGGLIGGFILSCVTP